MPIRFIFTIHCHQPLGQSEELIKEAYFKAYLPFIETFEKYPTIKFVAHYSGTLYEWFSKNHPEFLDKLKLLIRRGQLEVLTGGYYEPMLPMLSYDDTIGQIMLETDFIKKNFLRAPQGLWLTERLWDPNIPKTLSDAGISYTLIDDHHFHHQGFSADRLHGYYVSEGQGATIKVFPINNSLNSFIPFRMPSEILDNIMSITKGEGKKLLVFADDGEKFGAISGTNKWIYEDKWLDNFIALLLQNQNIIRTTTFMDHMEEEPPVGKVYIPSIAGKDSSKMSLPVERIKKYDDIYSEIRSFGKYDDYADFLGYGGYFKNYFVKYPEANNIYCKMLYVSQKIDVLEKGKVLGFSSKEREKEILDAKQCLWKSQSGPNYFHGSENRLYLPEMREALYEQIIMAETIIDRINRGNQKFIEAKTVDFDKDGFEEVLVSNNLINCYFSPRNGGALFELDYKAKSINLTNILTRYEEPYHNDPGGSGHVYDKYRKLSLLDHIMKTDTTFDQYRDPDHEGSGDFISGNYNASVKATTNEVNVKLSRKADIVHGNFKVPFEIIKTVTMFSGQTQANIEHEITNMSDIDIEILFGVEFNLFLNADIRNSYYLFPNIGRKEIDSCGEDSDIKSFKLVDESRGTSISLETDSLNTVWRYPIETVSKVDTGTIKRFQGTSLLVCKGIKIAAGGKWKNNIKVSIG